MPNIEPPDKKAQPLLRVIVDAIKAGRIREGDARTFLSYSEALELLGSRYPYYAGAQLQRVGLKTLNAWTIKHSELPKIAALIVNRKTRIPGKGFPKSHGYNVDDPQWKKWWLQEANRAINYDWTPFLTPVLRYRSQESKSAGDHVREDEEGEAQSYRKIITIEAGKRGGRPCIRGMRITVGDILGWLAAGMSEAEIIDDFPELTAADIQASLAFAADREKHAVSLAAMHR